MEDLLVFRVISGEVLANYYTDALVNPDANRDPL